MLKNVKKTLQMMDFEAPSEYKFIEFLWWNFIWKWFFRLVLVHKTEYCQN